MGHVRGALDASDRECGVQLLQDMISNHTRTMPPRSGTRRAAADEDAPTPAQTQRRRRDATPEEDEDVDMEDQEPGRGSGSLEQLSKGLVRYALSCEYSRKPLKRQDINEKGEQGTQ